MSWPHLQEIDIDMEMEDDLRRKNNRFPYIYILFCSILEEYLGAGFNPLSQRMAEKQQKYHQPDS
jgi:hypothetical protein